MRVVETGTAFRVLTVVTVLGIFALVTLGGVVRLTGSGLGCPDWPLCHGRVIPPLDAPTLIEYSHRLMATVVGILVLSTTLIVWRYYRKQAWLLVPATAGVLLLIAQVLLGGVTVLEELPDNIVMAHLATAEAMLASMVVVSVVALRGSSFPVRGDAEPQGRDLFSGFTLVALIGAFGLLLTGSYVAVSGYAPACGQAWPLCDGQLIPKGYNATMHMAHRVAAALVGLLILAVLIAAWRRRLERRVLGWTAAAVGGLFLAQIIVGATVLWTGFTLSARLLHLDIATLVLVGLTVLGVLSYSEPKYAQEGSGSA